MESYAVPKSATIKAINKFMILRLFQVLAVILMGVQLGVSYAHFMQMPGKLGLPLDCYILVQNQVISYRVKLAFIEYSVYYFCCGSDGSASQSSKSFLAYFDWSNFNRPDVGNLGNLHSADQSTNRWLDCHKLP